MKKKKSSSIVVRLRMAFLMPFAAFILIVISILGFQYRKRAMDDIVSQLTYEDEILAQALEARITNTQSSVNSIIINLNQTIPSGRLNHYKGPEIDAGMRKLIYQCMVNTFITFYNTDQVIVVWNNGVTWYENWTENYFMQSGGEELLREMEKQGVDNSGKWLQKVSSSKIAGEGNYFAKRYVDIATGKQLGYVILKETDVFAGVHSENADRSIYLFDSYGRLIESSNIQAISERDSCKTKEEEAEVSNRWRRQLEGMESNHRQQINQLKIARQWRLFSVTDMSSAMEDLNHSIIRILLATLIVLIMMYMIVCRIIDQIIHPIRELSDHMQNAQEQLPEPLQMQVKDDEVGILITRFNEMANRNGQLIHMLLEEKKQQERLKFSLLQSQIKPHFLYNTLDTIYCLVLMGRMEEGSRMTKLLSDYYRHVLSKGMDWVLLSEEVQQTEKYLQIQLIRYRDIMDFEILVDENVENIKIPKLTLQPLVENAIYHGIKPLGRKGHLTVHISQKERTLQIRVMDDGVGMSPDEFEESMQQEHRSEEGFGLRNVVDRLRIYYETRCTMKLERCEQGTTMLIEIKI